MDWMRFHRAAADDQHRRQGIDAGSDASEADNGCRFVHAHELGRRHAPAQRAEFQRDGSQAHRLLERLRPREVAAALLDGRAGDGLQRADHERDLQQDHGRGRQHAGDDQRKALLPQLNGKLVRLK